MSRLSKESIHKYLGKVYPEMVLSSEITLHQYVVNGSLQFHQVDIVGLTALDNPGLLNAINSDAYAAKMADSATVGILDNGSYTTVTCGQNFNITDSVNMSVFPEEGHKGLIKAAPASRTYFPDVIEKDALVHWRKVGNHPMVADPILPLSERLNSNAGYQKCYDAFRRDLASLGLQPSMVEFCYHQVDYEPGSSANLNLAVRFYDHRHKVGISVPGYSLFLRSYHIGREPSAGGSFGVTFGTYVPGTPARIFYGALANREIIEVEGVYASRWHPTAKNEAKRFDACVEISDWFKLPKATFGTLLNRDLSRIAVELPRGTPILGLPNVDFGANCLSVSPVIEDATVELPFVLKTYVLNSTDSYLMFDRSWYEDYYTTGYGIYTPRASNIQANTLKTWDDANHGVLVLRDAALTYTPAMTVKDLPEAKEYKRMRERACMTDNFLDQMATDKLTWRAVQDRVTRNGARDIWLTPVNLTSNVGMVVKHEFEQSVVSYVATGTVGNMIYKRDNLVITATDYDAEKFLIDKYFNNSATFSGDWSGFVEFDTIADTELREGSNKYTTSQRGEGQLVGFGGWINPSPLVSIDTLSEEQKFRLHLSCLVGLDPMITNLIKVCESFNPNKVIMKKLTK